MPFAKNDPRINRKGRPHKEKPLVKDEHNENDFVRWSRKNEYTRARYLMAIYLSHSWAAIEKLIDHGVITRHENESLEWTLNRESLAKLFYALRPHWWSNMKWGPIETAFNIKRGSLRYLVSNSGSRYYDDGEKNPDYEKVIKILEFF